MSCCAHGWIRASTTTISEPRRPSPGPTPRGRLRPPAPARKPRRRPRVSRRRRRGRHKRLGDGRAPRCCPAEQAAGCGAARTRAAAAAAWLRLPESEPNAPCARPPSSAARPPAGRLSRRRPAALPTLPPPARRPGPWPVTAAHCARQRGEERCCRQLPTRMIADVPPGPLTLGPSSYFESGAGRPAWASRSKCARGKLPAAGPCAAYCPARVPLRHRRTGGGAPSLLRASARDALAAPHPRPGRLLSLFPPGRVIELAGTVVESAGLPGLRLQEVLDNG
jgi:hypothetical protein